MPNAMSLSELDKRLNDARDEYRRAVGLKAEAFQFKRSVPMTSHDGSARQNASAYVEIAAMKYRRALRDFVKHLSQKEIETGDFYRSDR